MDVINFQIVSRVQIMETGGPLARFMDKSRFKLGSRKIPY